MNATDMVPARWRAALALLAAVVALGSPAPAQPATIAVAENISLVVDDWWQEIKSPYTNTKELIGGKGRDGALQARASTVVLRHSSPDAALARLKREAALTHHAEVLRIGGRPAVRTTDDVEMERRVPDLPPVHFTTQQVVTFVGVDRLVVKITASLAHGGGKEAADRIRQLAQGMRVAKPLPPRELDEAVKGLEQSITVNKQRGGARLSLGLPVRAVVVPRATRVTQSSLPVLAARRGELEVAVSPDANDVVIGTNSGTVFSNDGGMTWSATQALPDMGVIGVNFQRRGDPSVARAPSDRFYLSYLGRERRAGADCTAPGADCRDTVSIATSEPVERGNDFDFRSHVAVCDPASDPFGTDQPHMVIARQPSGLDREAIYVVWRRHVPNDADAPTSCTSLGAAQFTTVLTCSEDGGLTWPRSVKIDDRGRHPRVGVGRDGKAYVIAVRHSGGGAIDLTRVSSCADGLAFEEDFPVVVDNFDGVQCPVPGLDRCNNGNTLASPTVSPDPGRTLSVFVSFATRTANGNENIIVRASEDGGLTFPVAGVVNDTTVTARRFMPWSCAVAGGVYVGWYDREPATAGANDLTRYHAAFFRYETDNILGTIDSFTRFAGTDVSRGVADPQCALWPSAPRNIGDAENCSAQPQLAGLTPAADGTCNGAGPARCDFSDSANANPALFCCVGSGSPPKYGDYNGIACTGQRGFVAWASATPPAGAVAPPANSMGTYFATLSRAEPDRTVRLCPSNLRDCIGLRRGAIDLVCPDELCDIRVPVPKLCERVLDCPVCGPGQLCLGRAGISIDGLPPTARVRLIDAHGAVRAEASRAGARYRVPTRAVPFDATTLGREMLLEITAAFKTGRHSLRIESER